MHSVKINYGHTSLVQCRHPLAWHIKSLCWYLQLSAYCTRHQG